MFDARGLKGVQLEIPAAYEVHHNCLRPRRLMKINGIIFMSNENGGFCPTLLLQCILTETLLDPQYGDKQGKRNPPHSSVTSSEVASSSEVKIHKQNYFEHK